MQPILIVAFILLVSNSALGQTQAQLDRGKYIFTISGCKSCHTDTKVESQIMSGGLGIKTPFGIFYGPNITPDKEFGIGKWSDEDFVKAMRKGISPSGDHYFPSFPYTSYTNLTTADILDLKTYIFSLKPSRTPSKSHQIKIPFNIRFFQLFWKWLFFNEGPYVYKVERSKDWNRGAYITNGLGHCSECHTQRNILGGIESTKFLGGASTGISGGIVPNITQDRKTGIGNWTNQDLLTFLTMGMLPDGDFVGSTMAEVSKNISELTVYDSEAMALYLKSVPPIHNVVKK